MVEQGLLMHARTKKQVDVFLKSPTHAVMLTGPPGSGKRTLGRHMAASLLGTAKLDSHPYFTTVTRPEDKQDIPIDAIRQLIKSLSLKVPSKKAVNRVVFIEQAEDMNQESQNALLKLLEEPPKGTVFILTVPYAGSVLPTIASRTQNIAVLPVSQAAAKKYYGLSHSPGAVDSTWRLSGGGAGLIASLLDEDKDHPLKFAVEQAKKFLALDRYERILFLDGLADRQELALFLDALSRVLAALHRAAIAKNDASAGRRLLAARKEVDRAISDADLNVSNRLSGLQLVLKLSV